MIDDEINVICLCCMVLLAYFSYQLLYGNPNIFEGMREEEEEEEEEDHSIHAGFEGFKDKKVKKEVKKEVDEIKHKYKGKVKEKVEAYEDYDDKFAIY